MTELTFLIDLLLNHKLPKVTRDAVAARVKEVEGGMTTTRMVVPQGSGISPAAVSNQAPSMQAIMAKYPDLVPAPPPVAVIAQTPAAVAAMNARQEAINGALSGKVEKGRTSPRKF